MLVLANKILSYFFMQSLSKLVVTCTHRSNCTKIAGYSETFRAFAHGALISETFPWARNEIPWQRMNVVEKYPDCVQMML